MIWRKMVLQERIELSTSPLPRECSTTELLQRRRGCAPEWRSSATAMRRDQAARQSFPAFRANGDKSTAPRAPAERLPARYPARFGPRGNLGRGTCSDARGHSGKGARPARGRSLATQGKRGGRAAARQHASRSSGLTRGTLRPRLSAFSLREASVSLERQAGGREFLATVGCRAAGGRRDGGERLCWRRPGPLRRAAP